MTQRQPPLPAQGVGQPVALSGLARLLLSLHQADNAPPLKLVNSQTQPAPPATHDEPRRALSPIIS